jgi:calcium/calmodulin-dependent protein kinase I
LLPEIKAYMAKARLRRGIEMVKLTNRIEALKLVDDDPENPDFPANPKVPGAVSAAKEGTASGETGKAKLTRAMKGAIFREVVLAKVREMREQEQTLKVKEEVEKEAKRKSFSG